MRKKDKNRLDFEGQRDGERLLFIFRRHMISMRKGFYLLLIPFVISSIPPLIWQNTIEIFISPLIGLAVGLVLFFYHFMIWYFTIFIVTDQRIRQITQHGFFGKEVIELRLSKVQNISYNIPGFSGELFKYGTIIIQTYVGDLVINKVDHPSEVYDKLQDAVSIASNKQGRGEDVFV